MAFLHYPKGIVVSCQVEMEKGVLHKRQGKYFIECALEIKGCYKTEDIENCLTMEDAVLDLVIEGWQNTKDYGWICLRCAKRI